MNTILNHLDLADPTTEQKVDNTSDKVSDSKTLETLENIYRPDSILSKILESYLFRVEILTNAITTAMQITKDPSKREILAKGLKETAGIRAKLESTKESVPETLAFIKSELKRCATTAKNNIDITDIYNRESNICKSSDTLYTTDTRSLAKEYVRIKKALHLT